MLISECWAQSGRGCGLVQEHSVLEEPRASPSAAGCTAAAGWQQLEGKQEPDDPAPAVGSGGFGGPSQSGKQGGKPSVGALLLCCLSGTGALQGSGWAAAAARVRGAGAALPVRWQRHASLLSAGGSLTEADTPVDDCTSL